MLIVVHEMIRPSLVIEKDNDYWSAVIFLTDANKSAIVGKHYNIQLQIGYSREIWEFEKATIMLHPQPFLNNNKYILTYSTVRRI